MHDKFAEYADYYLGNQDFEVLLRSAIDWTRQYLAGYAPAGQASLRRSEFLRASSHAKGLRKLLAKIDHATIAAAMRPIASRPPEAEPKPTSGLSQGLTAGSSLSMRLTEVAYAMDVLERLADGLASAADREEPARHRPGTSDPIRFGVEALATLWAKARNASPTASFNKGKFGDFALVLLGGRGLGCDEANIRTAVRYVVRDQKQDQTGGHSPLPG